MNGRTRRTRPVCVGARVLASAVALASLDACATADRETTSAPVLVFAAADLRYALADLAARYHAAGGDSVSLVFGATGTLAAQIANGAPADLFFSADEAALAGLAARGAVVDSTRRAYAIGRLVLVAPASARVRDLADLARPAVRLIAIADPAHAPYGRAARQALQQAGLWDRVQPKVVFAPNVAQAYQFVRSGETDAGLVAAAVAVGAPAGPTPNVAAGAGSMTRLPFTPVDSLLYTPLRQAAAVVAAAPHAAGARRFLDYVTGPAGTPVLQRYGFTPVRHVGHVGGQPVVAPSAAAGVR